MAIRAGNTKKNFVCDPLWFGGLVIYALGSALQGAALSIGPQSVLTLFESFTLVCTYTDTDAARRGTDLRLSGYVRQQRCMRIWPSA